MEDYRIQHKLGDGAQGVVFKVEQIHTNEHYAMKIICCADQGQVNLALQEIKVLLQLRHSNIVSYVDFFLVFNSAKLRHEFERVAERNGTAESLKGLHSSLGSMRGSQTGSLRVFDVLSPGTTPDPSPEKPRRPVAGTGGGVPAVNLLSEGVRTHWLKEEEIAVCLVMELCSSGDMSDTIKETKSRMMETGKHPISEAQVLAWMEQSAAALQYIHDKGFLHRDLKPTNIFFDAHRNVRLGDFGLAATVGHAGRKSCVGTPYYLAPERMLQQRYDGKVDIWGLGVIVLELLTLREQPINSMVLENPAVVDTVTAQVTKMGFSKKLAALIRDMIQRRPEDRPEAAVILRRLQGMTAVSPHPGMSASLFVGMSCPRLGDLLCDVCEVEPAATSCGTCAALFCLGCDQARHKHQSRQSHDRSGINGSLSQHQQTLSTSRTSPANLSDQSRSFGMRPSNSPTVMSHGAGAASRLPSHERSGQFPASPAHSRAYARLHNALSLPPGNSMSMSDFSLSQSVLSPSQQQQQQQRMLMASAPSSPLAFTSKNNGGTGHMGALPAAADAVLRVPGDFPTLAAALQAVTAMRHIRKILVAGGTVHNAPLTLTKALPENLKIVGEAPAPVLEVVDSPFALLCASGKGVVENIVIRHVGRAAPANRKPLAEISADAGYKTSAATDDSKAAKKPPHPSAVLITGGSWAIRKCRISCVGGSGVTVGAESSGNARGANGGARSLRRSREMKPDRVPRDGDDDEDDDDGDRAVVDPVVSKCHFMDVTTAGIVVKEKARGLYEGNSFSGCGYAAFLLKRDSSARVRANRITDGAETGIFCQDAQGSIEYNLIAQNAGCGIVVKGAGTTAVFRKNRVLSNMQAGFFCCDRAAPFITDNEISHNNKAGVLIKTKAAPKVSRNIIEGGKEAGVYVFDHGSGIIEENKIRGNMNAGLLVTTAGNPHVIHNVLSKNAYEGIWVCKDGGGTYCDNDLRGNARGAMDVDAACKVTWVGNTEK